MLWKVIRKKSLGAVSYTHLDVYKRQAYGYNELDEGEKRSLLSKFIDQFKDLMIIILDVYKRQDVTIRRLREKIEDTPSRPEYILTRRGVGYYMKNYD